MHPENGEPAGLARYVHQKRRARTEENQSGQKDVLTFKCMSNIQNCLSRWAQYRSRIVFLAIDSYSCLRTGLLEIMWVGEGFYGHIKCTLSL